MGIGSSQLNRLDRRAALRWLASGAGLALLTACGQPPTTGPATTAPAGPAANPAAPAAASSPQAAEKPAGAQPKSGGTLRVGQVGDIATLDATFTPGVAEIAWSVHDRLTAYDDKLQPQPMLAESW